MIYDSHGEDMDGRSVYDEVNPAVRLFCLLFLTVSYILVDSALGHLFAFAFLLALLYLSQLDFSEVLSSVKWLLPLLLFVIFLNFCFSSPQTAFFKCWVFAPSVPGAVRGALICLKISEITVLFDMFNALTKPEELVSTLNTVFRPLSLLGIAHEQISAAVSSSFWFLDYLKKKFYEISQLQKSSGLYCEAKPSRSYPADKIKLLLPTLYEAFYTARERAALLEARGVPEYLRKNTDFPKQLSMYDYCAMTVCAAFFAVQLIIF